LTPLVSSGVLFCDPKTSSPQAGFRVPKSGWVWLPARFDTGGENYSDDNDDDQGSRALWKVLDFFFKIPGPRKSWKITLVLEIEV